jgi:hypothetical protein
VGGGTRPDLRVQRVDAADRHLHQDFAGSRHRARDVPQHQVGAEFLKNDRLHVSQPRRGDAEPAGGVSDDGVYQETEG